MKKEVNERYLKSGREATEEELYKKAKLYHRLYPCRPFVFYEVYGQIKVRVEVFKTPAIGDEWEKSVCGCGVGSYIFKHSLLHHYHKDFLVIINK